MSGRFIRFTENEQAAKILRQWWEALEHNKGDRAELRRARNVTEVFFSPTYHRLYAELRAIGYIERVHLAAVAGLLAHIKKDVPSQTFASLMQTGADGKRALSDLRFRRLLKHGNVNELYPALIRVLRLLEGKANVLDLADSIMAWGDGWRGDEIRKEWAFAYYTKAPREA